LPEDAVKLPVLVRIIADLSKKTFTKNFPEWAFFLYLAPNPTIVGGLLADL